MTFPTVVGACTILMLERPTPDATFKRMSDGIGEVKPTVFFGAPTGFAGILVHPALPSKDQVALRLVSSAGQALPAEIGKRFFQHFGVHIVDGIGINDSNGLTKTKAFVVLKPNAATSDAELKAFVKDKLAPYKYPRQIEFVKELPKTETGKIQRFKLRAQETQLQLVD